MSKSYVGMGYEVCPVCGEHHTETVLLDKRLKDTLEQSNCTGMSFCPEHQKQRNDGYIFLIEVSNSHDSSVLKPSDANRTGNYAAMKREAFSQVFDTNIGDKPIVFVEVGVLNALARIS